jgi:hypothetical protein
MRKRRNIVDPTIAILEALAGMIAAITGTSSTTNGSGAAASGQKF